MEGFEMNGLARVERVARISAIENDVNSSFKRKDDGRNAKQESAFHRILTQTVNKKEREEAAKVQLADTAEFTRATQSLFYANMVKINLNVPNIALAKAY